MIKMKALRSFGVPGSNEGKVKRGREITAATEARAKELESSGLAYRLETVVHPQPSEITEIVTPLNKAATGGPLGSLGGMTGAEAPVPSSPADHPPRRRRSPRSKDTDLLS